METEHIEDSLRALLPKDDSKAVEKPAEAALRLRMSVTLFPRFLFTSLTQPAKALPRKYLLLLKLHFCCLCVSHGL